MAPRGDGGPGDAWGHSQTPAPTAVPRLRARPGAHRGKKPPRRAQRAPRAPRLCQRKEKKTNKGERSHLLSSLSSVPAKTALGSCRLRQHAQKPCSTPGLELWKISGITKAFLKAPGARRLLQGRTSPGHAVPVPTSPRLCRSCFEEQASCSALGIPKTEGHRDLVPLSPPKPNHEASAPCNPSQHSRDSPGGPPGHVSPALPSPHPWEGPGDPADSEHSEEVHDLFSFPSSARLRGASDCSRGLLPAWGDTHLPWGCPWSRTEG